MRSTPFAPDARVAVFDTPVMLPGKAPPAIMHMAHMAQPKPRPPVLGQTSAASGYQITPSARATPVVGAFIMLGEDIR